MASAFQFHLATPEGEGGIALFELYGDGAGVALARLFKPRGGELPQAGHSRLGELLDPTGALVDEAVVARLTAETTWFRLPCWTVSVHAGPWIQQKTREALAALGGAPLDICGVLRLSVRAGSLDSVQAAAYELLIGAHTGRAARFFARQHSGELSAMLREGLDAARSGRGDEAARLARALVDGSRRALRLGQPLRVLIAGRPNAGKSTLFNRFAEDERAIVTPIPGTTRDALEELVAVEDYPVVVTDSAGLRPLAEAGDIEREGIRRALERDDDVVLYLLAHPWAWTDEDRAHVDAFSRTSRVVPVASLADLAPGHDAPDGLLRVSALTGEGLDDLRRALVRGFIDDRDPPCADVPAAVFTARQIGALSRATDPSSLDAIRIAYIECLDSSWP